MELPEQILLLEVNARALAESGNHADAEKLFLQLLEAAPQHVPALQYLAARTLEAGQLEQAQRYIERAIRTNPTHAELHQNLGIILRAQGFLEGALLAFDHALARNPHLAILWIQRGDILQALGRGDKALAAYCQAESLAGDLVTLSARTPPRVARTVRRAASLLHQCRNRFLNDALAPLRAAHMGELDHAERALVHMLGTAKLEYTDPLQRPMFCHYPGLEAHPFYDHRRFPELRMLEQRTREIRTELKRLLKQPEKLRPYIEMPADREAQWTALNRSRKWSAYHLYWNGERLPEHWATCPETVASIDALPLVRIQSHAPEIFFSILQPHTHIPPHFGLTNYKLTVHLPLLIPPHCAIRVDDETRQWRLGECLIFDDSFEHEAWNRSDKPHAVLIFEVWHPNLVAHEREFLATAVAAINRFDRKYRLRPGQKVPSQNLASP